MAREDKSRPAVGAARARGGLLAAAVVVIIAAAVVTIPSVAPLLRHSPDPSDVIELTAHLVTLQSVNPALEDTGAGEDTLISFAEAWLRRRGLEVRVVGHGKSRSSLVAVARGSGGGRSLLLNGHVDTVGVTGYAGDALKPRRLDGKLYGRGSYDMKSGAAAGMVAAAAAKERRLRGDVVLALVGDEETSSAGTLATLREPEVQNVSGAIILEPSHLELVAGHRGFAWYDVAIKGRAAHGSRPDLGVDAIVKAGSFLQALASKSDEWKARPEEPLLGHASLHAGVIQGGEGLSTYPSYCNVSVEARLVAAQTAQSVLAEIQDILDDLKARDPDFSATVHLDLQRPAFLASQDSDVLRTLSSAAAKTLGASPPIVGNSFWTDAALLQEAGLPTVMFGATGTGAHAAEEWVDEASVRQVNQILLDTAVEFCG